MFRGKGQETKNEQMFSLFLVLYHLDMRMSKQASSAWNQKAVFYFFSSKDEK